MAINLGGINVQPNTHFVVNMPQGVISAESMENARLMLQEIVGKDVVWPMGWSNEALVSGRGEYVGTFAKRVSKFIYVTYRTKIAPDDLARVAGEAARGVATNTAYNIDFDENLSWTAGSFGDPGSCWWDRGQNYLRCFRAIGGKAVRFWNPTNPTQGIGRAWVLPDQPHTGTFLLFNGYLTSRASADPTEIAARVVAQHFGFTYKRVIPEFRTHTSRDTFFYLNGAKGYVLGPMETMNRHVFNENLSMRFDDDLIRTAINDAERAYGRRANHLEPLVLA